MDGGSTVVLGGGGSLYPVCLAVVLYTPGWEGALWLYEVGVVYVLGVWLWCNLHFYFRNLYKCEVRRK